MKSLAKLLYDIEISKRVTSSEVIKYNLSEEVITALNSLGYPTKLGYGLTKCYDDYEGVPYTISVEVNNNIINKVLHGRNVRSVCEVLGTRTKEFYYEVISLHLSKLLQNACDIFSTDGRIPTEIFEECLFFKKRYRSYKEYLSSSTETDECTEKES